MLQVTATLSVRSGSIERALELSREHVERSRQEPGCVRHEVFVDPTDATRLFFFERWQDREALERHFAVPASARFVAELADLLTHPPTMDVGRVEDEAPLRPA